MVGSAAQLDLIALAGGRFVMGSDHDRRDEAPAHPVSVAPFRAARAPVTNADYALFVEATGAPPPSFAALNGFAAPDLPVVGISWHEAVAFCAWLSRQSGVRLRLPTEAEREYAARGGLAGSSWPDAVAGWPDDAQRRFVAEIDAPHVPAAACANGFGLRCMADNVHEWCSDWYDRAWYARSPSESPVGPDQGVRRSSRGGSWRHKIKFTRVSARSSLVPTYRYNDYGFRVYADAE